MVKLNIFIRLTLCSIFTQLLAIKVFALGVQAGGNICKNRKNCCYFLFAPFLFLVLRVFPIMIPQM
jgi:hypothetical protein